MITPILFNQISNSVIFLLLLAIYFSTFLTTVFSILLLVMWLFGKKYRISIALLKTNPIILWALLLLADFTIGMFYTSADWQEALQGLNKYRELLLIFILPAFLQNENLHKNTWLVFSIASAITLFSSYAIYFGVFDYLHENDPTIKSRITHSILISFFAFYCLHQFMQKTAWKFLYLGLFVISVTNLFFLVSGRSGQLIFIALMLLFAIQRLDKKKLFLFLTILILFLGVFIKFSDNSTRIYTGITESENYLQTGKGGNDTSMGQRLTFWKNSLHIIADSPLFGQGTGSYTTEYAKVMAKTEHLAANPHNEYLMITAQVGLVGLGLFLAFLYSQYQFSQTLKNQDKWLAQGVLLSLAINSCVNSSFIDFTEGYWYTLMIALCFSSALQTNRDSLNN